MAKASKTNSKTSSAAKAAIRDLRVRRAEADEVKGGVKSLGGDKRPGRLAANHNITVR